MNRKLPEFDDPPAVETLMGFHFARLNGWNVLRLGQVWGLFQPEYPNGNLLPPLIDAAAVLAGTVQFDETRATFSDADQCQLVQVQSSAFLRNWRRTPDLQAYHHYSQLLPRFKRDWEKFTGFLKETKFGQPEVFQCEVTYLNHLVRGKEWTSYNDLAKIIKIIAPRIEVTEDGRVYEYLPEASGINLAVGYNLADVGIALQFLVQSAIRQPDGTEVIQLTVTAKGAPHKKDDADLFETLNRCHEAVILGFDDITTDHGHRLWKKR